MSANRGHDFQRGFELALAANQLQHCVEKFDKDTALDIIRKNAQDGLPEWTGSAISNTELAGSVGQYNLAVSRACNKFRILY